MRPSGKRIIVSLVLCVVLFAIILLGEYNVRKNIDSWLYRAQVSSEPNDMLEYMTLVRCGMEKYGMTSGNAALIFKTPASDMTLIYRTVNQHIDQAKILTEMDRKSPEYQTGLDNLRGSIRELALFSEKYWETHQGLFLWILLIGSGMWFLAELVVTNNYYTS